MPYLHGDLVNLYKAMLNLVIKDEVVAANKNSIDNTVIAAKSMPNVSVCCAADVAPILNLVNIDISQYDAHDIADMAKVAGTENAFKKLQDLCNIEGSRNFPVEGALEKDSMED